MSMFTQKYAPKNSKQVFGQQDAVAQLQDFIQNYKEQKQKAALIFGPIGNGKTSSVYAIAKELGYDILEMNSSDLRNQAEISSFLDASLGQQSLFFTPKLILIDEVDNISGVKDRGCVPAILKGIEKSQFPVILTANDIFDKKMKPLKKACLNVEYQKLDHKVVRHAIEWVAQQEGITCEPKAVASLARQVDGDVRGALIDLQGCSSDKSFTFNDVINLSDRKRTETIINALHLIFKSSSVETALPALQDLDIDMREVFLWMDENLCKEYTAPKALAKAYEHLARADVFQGRIRRWQHWRFLIYISNLLTAGVASAKDEKSPFFVQYKPTMRLLRIWQSNMKNAKKKEIAAKLARKTHSSLREAMQQLDYFRKAMVNPRVAEELELSSEEVAWLRNT